MLISAIATERLDSRHVVSIAKMGDYQEFLNQRNKPLREVDPSQVRVHTFGNPFKLKQDQVSSLYISQLFY